jgi:hypothetical protein
MLARFAPCHRVGGYLFFKSSGLLFPRLTNQHPLTRLPHRMRLRLFYPGSSRYLQMLKVGCKHALGGYRFTRKWAISFCNSSVLFHAPRRSLVGHKGSAKGSENEMWAFPYRELTRQMSSDSSALLFGAAMAERDSQRTGLLSQGTRGTLERSREGSYARFVF